MPEYASQPFLAQALSATGHRTGVKLSQLVCVHALGTLSGNQRERATPRYCSTSTMAGSSALQIPREPNTP